VPFDRFHDRVMFPIGDLRGRVVAFGGRALDKEARAKYLNSPETPLFHKGGTLYNIATARAAAHKGAPVIAVEGYVDVIAMVGAGFEATVAPLGTALTADQLGLLWKMADEPTLCFDGDGAGRRAAYKAVDTALPLLRPGKSLRFATLPDGNDPDDLVRSGGRAAIDDVLAGARPLAHMLWMRETEAGGFDTPERRAALEARLGAVMTGIGEESVRRYYRKEFESRLRSLFDTDAPAGRRAAGGRFPQARGPRLLAGSGGSFGGQTGRQAGGGRGGAPRPRPTGIASGSGPYLVSSPQLAASPIHRGDRAAISRREALILQTALNYPWLLHDHLEDLAEVEFRFAEAERVKVALIDIFAHGGASDRETMAAELARRGLAEPVGRIEKAITTASVWGARPDAGPADVLITWKQLIALHRQWHSLIKELKDAEQALGRDATEANYSWLQDVKARLSVIDGTEALVEGFGASSGRAGPSF
jgi:DNA primase